MLCVCLPVRLSVCSYYIYVCVDKNDSTYVSMYVSTLQLAYLFVYVCVCVCRIHVDMYRYCGCVCVCVCVYVVWHVSVYLSVLSVCVGVCMFVLACMLTTIRARVYKSIHTHTYLYILPKIYHNIPVYPEEALTLFTCSSSPQLAGYIHLCSRWQLSLFHASIRIQLYVTATTP